MTRRDSQKFRQFFQFVTDRFRPAKSSLGQILERARANGEIVRQSVCGRRDSQGVGVIRTDEGQVFQSEWAKTVTEWSWFCASGEVVCTVVVRAFCWLGDRQGPFAVQARSHRICVVHTLLGNSPDHCRSEPARDSAMSADNDVEGAGPFAGKPAPTGFVLFTQYSATPPIIVGVSLLAIARCQPTTMSKVPAPSRASPLPQDLWCSHSTRQLPRSLSE
jgi:hypothetical protein